MRGAGGMARRLSLLYAVAIGCCLAVASADLISLLSGSPAPPAAPAVSAAGAYGWQVAAIRVDAGPLDRPSPASRKAANASLFVRTEGKRFVLGCKQFMPVGWNSFTLLEQAAELPHGSFGTDYSSGGRVQVTQMLDDAHRLGLNVVRLWAFTVTTTFPLQLSPSVYDSGIFRGLDFILDAAQKRNLKVVLVLSDWTAPGGVNTYVSWSATARSQEEFFSDRTCREHYKRNALNLISRTNSFNGLKYRDDPTIFSWELMNEPRCRGCPARLQSWIQEMASFLAMHAPHQLRTVGEEGFFSFGAREVNSNPAVWARLSGQDFYSNHNIAEITHAACHVWPQTWAILGGSSGITPGLFLAQWVAAHIADSDRLGKPLILEEFGHSAVDLTLTTRESFYSQALALIEASVAKGAAGCGSAFWTWYSADNRAQTGSDQYAVFTDDAVFTRLAEHARVLASVAHAAAPPVGCGKAG